MGGIVGMAGGIVGRQGGIVGRQGGIVEATFPNPRKSAAFDSALYALGEIGHACRAVRLCFRPDKRRLNNTRERSRDCRRPIMRCSHDPATFHLLPFLSAAALVRAGVGL